MLICKLIHCFFLQRLRNGWRTGRMKKVMMMMRMMEMKRPEGERVRRRVRKMRLRVKKVNTYFYVILFR